MFMNNEELYWNSFIGTDIIIIIIIQDDDDDDCMLHLS
jgi:hypothetical protein